MAPPCRIPLPPPGRLDPEGIADSIAFRMMYSIAKDEHTATPFDVYQALAYAVRDRLVARWFHTQSAYYKADATRLYHLSLEFLMGPALVNNTRNLGAKYPYIHAMRTI